MESNPNVDKTTQKQWMESYTIKVVIAWVAFLGSFFTVIQVIISWYTTKVFTINGIRNIVVALLLLTVVVVVVPLCKVQRNHGYKSQEDYNNFLNIASKTTHFFLHDFRNSFYRMENSYDEGINSFIEFEEKTTREVNSLLGKLSEKLTEMLGSEIRSCVKCICFTEKDEKDPSKIQVVTFARNAGDIDALIQEHYKPVPIDENTDFFEIYQNGKNNRARQYFYEDDLVAYDEKLRKSGEEYKNSNKFWRDDYRTTIVCPIRRNSKTSTCNSVETHCDLIGFLCVDSMTPGVFNNPIYGDLCLDMLTGFADILYLFFDHFIDIVNQFNNDNQKELSTYV